MASNRLSCLTPIIQWYEGMMLSPHHFQQADLRQTQIFAHQLNLLSTCHWGIHSLKIDPVVMPDGLVRILEIEAVMPDGLIASYSADMKDIPPLELDISDLKDDFPDNDLTILLCIPQRLPDTSPIVGEHPRFYSINWPAVKDENVDANALEIPRLFPRLFLHAGTEAPANCLSFPIFKIDFIDQCFVLKDFTAPCFFIERSSKLWAQCAEISQKMREKVTFLTDRWQNQVGTPLAYETEGMLRPIMMALPSFEAMIHGQTVSPYTLYQKLCETVGFLCALRLSQVPPILPSYQHNDLNSCFLFLIDLIKEYLKTVENSFAAFTFLQKDRLYSLRVHKEYCFDGNFYIGLKAPKGMTEAQLEDWMNESVVACDFALEKVQTRRVTGAPRQVLHGEELYELMPSRGVIVFKVPFDSEFMSFDQKLNIFNPADHPDRRPADITLYVKKGVDQK